MSSSRRMLAAAAAVLALALPLTAVASHGSADDASPNMLHVANLPPPAEFLACDRGPTCFNSDLAFWGGGGLRGGFTQILAQGNYEGFRLVDISDPANPTQISVLECRGNQGDVSFYQAKSRLLLIQSIEEPVTTAACATAVDTPVVSGTNPATLVPSTFRQKGFEGLRIFDVSDPRSPAHIASVNTACGSHTHTTITDARNQRAIVYVSSYPSGLRVTRLEDLALPGRNCVPDHNKISIVEIPDADPASARVLKEQPLHADTAVWTGPTGNGGSPVRGCHDITVFDSGSKKVAAGACLEEGQLWDVSDPANPTVDVPGRHTHIRNFFVNGPTPPFRGLFHTASFTWDGEVVLFTDEWQGGGAHGCDGPADTRGNIWFYDNVSPGATAPLRGRYILPRPQPSTETCTQHNGNVIPTNDGYIGVSSAYQAGTTVFDFSDVLSLPPITVPNPSSVPTAATEVAFYDAKNDPSGPTGVDNAWSSYWHNNYVYVSSGLPSATRPGARGLDVYMLLGAKGRLVPAVTDPSAPEVGQYRARIHRYQNPQTQD
ncbi:MAG: hypothetical protein H0W97_11245 [Actinobacteria bacterium]|nr:hypothetical protein [Actinomycetota bacterium]MBA3739124.1 hypothetical protein [Actinomycetota bacterium]